METRDDIPAFGTVHCHKQILHSVTLCNDVGGTSELPIGKFRVLLLKTWLDPETGTRCVGELLDPMDIEKARLAGITGYTPEDYRKCGAEHYAKALEAARRFDPTRVFFDKEDFTPEGTDETA